MQEFIRLAEVMDRIRNGESFSIKYITCDRKRRTGGEIKFYPKAILKNIAKQPQKNVPHSERNIMPMPNTKNPKHDENGTINILLPDASIRKVHVRLIIGFNNKRVVY